MKEVKHQIPGIEAQSMRANTILRTEEMMSIISALATPRTRSSRSIMMIKKRYCVMCMIIKIEKGRIRRFAVQFE